MRKKRQVKHSACVCVCVCVCVWCWCRCVVGVRLWWWCGWADLVRLFRGLVQALKSEFEFALFEVEVSEGGEGRGVALLGRGGVGLHGGVL